MRTPITDSCLIPGLSRRIFSPTDPTADSRQFHAFVATARRRPRIDLNDELARHRLPVCRIHRNNPNDDRNRTALAPDTPTPHVSGMPCSRDDAEALDRSDPLAATRHRFALPPSQIYLDGNSLGPLSRASADAVDRTVREDWGEQLIGSWNSAGWVDLPRHVGRQIAPLIGAGAEDVIATDSTSINLFKLLDAALAIRPDRPVILTETGNFPTDLYITDAVASNHGAARVRHRR